jgi:hypothetical protein
MPVVAILFYDVIVAVHVMAIILAFGVTFAYPLLEVCLVRNAPESMPAFHRAQVLVSRALITPAATVALLAGIYLAGDRDYFSELWVQVPFAILIIVLGLTGAFFIPTEKRLAEAAERGVDGEPYQALVRRHAMVGATASGLVLVAVFFMVTKLGG